MASIKAQIELDVTDEQFEQAVENVLKNNPDYVLVVRCKDCKHSTWDEAEQMYKCVYSAEFDDDIGEYLGFAEYHDGDFFCSYGERKDNERKAD